MNSSAGPNSNRQKTNQNIQVYVRVRPLNAREKGIRSMEAVQVAPPKEIYVNHLVDFKSTKKFTFDRTFGPDSRQSEIYQTVVAPLIEEVLSGYNCTVFAYGQTGTGKTHTMVGTECPELRSSWEDESMIGIIPRALSHLFDELRMMELEFSMRISYLELYNEELCDLLSSDDSARIRIFDDSTKKGSVIVQGLEEIPVHSKDDVYKLLEKGQERRKTATTLMNAQSSRSHTVFSILVHIKENNIDGEEMLKIGKLNLVDLAGSENISKSGNEKGIRTRETVNINQSLLTLGRVITALVERTPHIPYRESKLTRLLQESLGGRTKTSIIATISPGHKDLEETLSTLEYAHRAKNIQNRPEVNQKLTKKTVLKEYTEEIDKLKRDLMAARDKNGIYLAEETYSDIQFKLDSQNRELTEKMLLIKALKDDLANKERIFNEVSLNLVVKSEELNKKEKFLEATKNELDLTKRILHNTKKRSKEKQVLLENHVQTEEQLTSQAMQILEVADVATNDTEKLHSTIERRKTVDSQIKNTCTEFVNKMNKTFDEMSKQLENLCQDHSSHYRIILDEISSSTKMNQQFTKNAINKISTISSHHGTSLDELNNLVEKHSKVVDDNYVIHKDAFNAIMNKLKMNEETTTQNIEECFMEIKNHITDQNGILVESYSNIKQLLSGNHAMLKEFSEKIQQNLTETIKTVKDKFDEKQDKMNSVIQNKILINDKRNKLLMEFLESMQTLEKEDSSGIEEHKKIAEFDTIMQPLDSDLNNQIQLVAENTSQFESNIAKTEAEVTHLKSSVAKLNEDSTTKTATGCELISCFHKDNKAQIDEIISLHEKHVENISSLIGTHKQDIGAIVTSSSEKMQQICQNTSELITKETNRTKNRETENSALATSLQNCVKHYNANYSKHLQDCKQSLEAFHTKELKTYSPTGETPSKRQFSYPRVLASTSPHDMIIKRFRYENEYSDLDSTSVMEDSESTLPEISEDLAVVNSTPLRLGGNEILGPLEEQNCIKSIQILKPSKSQSRKNSPVFYCSKDNKENTY